MLSCMNRSPVQSFFCVDSYLFICVCLPAWLSVYLCVCPYTNFFASCSLCRVEACLPHCQQFEVNDAQAYLLERLGDIAAAIKLYVQDIQRCNAALIQALLQGHVHLPNVMTASGRCAQACQECKCYDYTCVHNVAYLKRVLV